MFETPREISYATIPAAMTSNPIFDASNEPFDASKTKSDASKRVFDVMEFAKKPMKPLF